MKMLVSLLLSMSALACFTGRCQAQAANLPAPAVTAAADGIFAAFQSHPLVALGDNHGMAQEEDFFAALIRDPRFAKDVGNVVVEFGDAAQQATLDRR